MIKYTEVEVYVHRTLSPEKPANSKTLSIRGGKRERVCKQRRPDKLNNTNMQLYTCSHPAVQIYNVGHTRLNAPIPNAIPPSK